MRYDEKSRRGIVLVVAIATTTEQVIYRCIERSIANAFNGFRKEGASVNNIRIWQLFIQSKGDDDDNGWARIMVYFPCPFWRDRKGRDWHWIGRARAIALTIRKAPNECYRRLVRSRDNCARA